MPLVGDSDNEGDDEDGDLMDIDVNDAAASISKSMEGFSGSKVESMMKKLLIAHKNVVVELPVMDEDDVETGEYSQEMEVGWIGVFGRKQIDGVIVHITEQGFPFTLSGQRFEIVFAFILHSDFTDIIKLVLYGCLKFRWLHHCSPPFQP